MLQQRIPVGEGGRWYNPDRDLAYCFPSLARAALSRLDRAWQPWFREYFESAGVTPGDLDRAAQALAVFYGLCPDPEIANPREALQKAGWFDAPDGAQVAVCMMLGQVLMCSTFSAVRDVTFDDAAPLDGNALFEAARQAHRQLTRPGPLARLRAYTTGLLWRLRSRSGRVGPGTPPPPPR